MMKNKFLMSLVILMVVFLQLMLVSAVNIESVSLNPSIVEPGENAQIEINLENNLQKDAEDITLILDFSAVPIAPLNSNEITIDKIKEDGRKRILFSIVTLGDAEAGVYKIPVEISYTDEDEEKHSKNSMISVTINSAPKISVEVEDGLILKGQSNDIVTKIVNKGLSDVKFLEIKAKNSPHYTLFSSGTQYIGDLDSDDFDSSEFKIIVKANAPKTISFPVQITYKDALNNEYEEEVELIIKAYSRDEALQLGLIQKSYTTTIIVIIGIVIVVWFVYRKIKKYRKKKKLSAQK